MKEKQIIQKVMMMSKIHKIVNDMIGKNKEKFEDDIGYYTGYCQCNCPACKNGKKHCQGLICRGD